MQLQSETPPFTAGHIILTMKSLGLNLELIGDAEVSVERIAAHEDAGRGTLIFLDKKESISDVLAKKPAVVVTSKALAPLFERSGITILIAPYVPLAHAFIKQKFGARDFSEGWENSVHPTAVVHESAELAKGVVVEPRAVIGRGVKIGEGARIMAGAVIENDVTIGARSLLHPSCVIGYACTLGEDVVVGSGTVVGSEGYGFAQDAKRKSHSIPQTGIVVIEDRVRLGANCCIDRAAYRETRIGAGTKIDNLCHIAHNVEIGEDCLLTSMLCVAGSSKIGNRVITSGQTGISDHVSICDDAVLLHRAGVTKDIVTPGAYAGLPTQLLSDYMKNSAIMRNATDLRRRISVLEKARET